MFQLLFRLFSISFVSMDRLTHFLQRFELHAQLLHNGALQTPLTRPRASIGGTLHVVLAGAAVLLHGRKRLQLSGPSVVFFARSAAHNLSATADDAYVVSATVAFGRGDENPMLQGMPSPLVTQASDLADLAPLLGVLSAEAQELRCGHTTMIERLLEALLIRLMRMTIESRLMDAGLIAGLAEPRLAKALTAMHAVPDAPWDLDHLAAVAGMSRSRFAGLFTDVMGMPAGEYLRAWRIGLAKGMLRAGRPIKMVAADVGYGSAMAFSRAFSQMVGTSPKRWLLANAG